MDALLASIAAAGVSGVVAFAIYFFHAMRSDFNGLRSDVRADIAALREEMRQGFAEIRAEIARLERSPR